jgi:hypothetical protein
MPLPMPNLDDKSFDDLVREAVSRIPIYAPRWTDHNATDPGITLIELFAWLTEMQIYRLNRVTERDLTVFLRTLGIWTEKEASIESAINRARADQRQVHRAVTSADYEYLIMNAGMASRVKAIAGYYPGIEGYLPNTVSVIIVPVQDCEIDDSIGEIYAFLEDYRLLATEVFVFPAVYFELSLKATVVKKQQYLNKTVEDKASLELKNFLNPINGGPEGKGWPFGRPVYLSEIIQVLANCSEVDYVKSVESLDLINITGDMKYKIGNDAAIKDRIPEKLEIPRHALVKPGEIKIDIE